MTKESKAPNHQLPTPHGQSAHTQGNGVEIHFNGMSGHIVSSDTQGTDIRELPLRQKGKSRRRFFVNP